MQQNLLSGSVLFDRGSGTGLTTGTCSTVYVRALKPKPHCLQTTDCTGVPVAKRKSQAERKGAGMGGGVKGKKEQ